MCGITGVFTNRPEVGRHLEAVRRMTGLMTRRGPDDEGFWDDGAHLALGFRRLAILDLSPAGHQPMESPCGRYVIAFNGEVYNFRELRAELESRGHRFRSSSDTEVVLLALAEWGEAALRRFNGMFALAWYDRERKQLLLARDAMGIKPLYFVQHSEGVAFGSQYDQVANHAYCSRRLSPASLGLFLRLGYVPAPRGLFENTALLPAGHLARLEPGQSPCILKYYESPEQSDEISADSSAVEAADAAIGSAVRRQMVSDVPLGAFLSGGVDSPLVAAHMRRATERVRAFTIGCTDPAYDEAPVARAYAETLALEHTVDRVGPAECLKLVEEGAKAFSEPFADFSSLPSLLLCRSTRQHVTVALSGDGGDELFWGYPRFWKMAGSVRWFQKPWALRAAAYGVLGRTTRKVPRGILFSDPGAWQFDGQCFSGLRDADLEAVCPEARELPGDFSDYRYSGPLEPDALARWLRQNELWGHLQMVLLKMDRASMHYSLEVRVPVLDLEVAGAAARISPSACMKDGLGKLPLRGALARAVPPDRIPQRKAGFTVPLGDWLRGELRPMVEDLLLSGDPYPSGLLNRRGQQDLYSQHLAGRDRTRAIWSLLSLQLWAREHLHSFGAGAEAPYEIAAPVRAAA